MKIHYHFTLIIISGITGGFVVMAGAFGAHALKEYLEESAMTDVWQTASMYGLIHAAMALLWVRSGSNYVLPAWFWIAGVWFFSGSLFGLALGGPSILGPITPFGGLMFILGWFSVVKMAFAKEEAQNEEN